MKLLFETIDLEKRPRRIDLVIPEGCLWAPPADFFLGDRNIYMQLGAPSSVVITASGEEMSTKEKFEQALKYLKSELGGSEADLVDDLIELHTEFCKEYNNYNIGLTHEEAFKAMDDFLLDCEWITSDEREDIVERLVLVKEGV